MIRMYSTGNENNIERDTIKMARERSEQFKGDRNAFEFGLVYIIVFSFHNLQLRVNGEFQRNVCIKFQGKEIIWLSAKDTEILNQWKIISKHAVGRVLGFKLHDWVSSALQRETKTFQWSVVDKGRQDWKRWKLRLAVVANWQVLRWDENKILSQDYVWWENGVELKGDTRVAAFGWGLGKRV